MFLRKDDLYYTFLDNLLFVLYPSIQLYTDSMFHLENIILEVFTSYLKYFIYCKI